MAVNVDVLAELNGRIVEAADETPTGILEITSVVVNDGTIVEEKASMGVVAETRTVVDVLDRGIVDDGATVIVLLKTVVGVLYGTDTVDVAGIPMVQIEMKDDAVDATDVVVIEETGDVRDDTTIDDVDGTADEVVDEVRVVEVNDDILEELDGIIVGIGVKLDGIIVGIAVKLDGIIVNELVNTVVEVLNNSSDIV